MISLCRGFSSIEQFLEGNNTHITNLIHGYMSVTNETFKTLNDELRLFLPYTILDHIVGKKPKQLRKWIHVFKKSLLWLATRKSRIKLPAFLLGIESVLSIISFDPTLSIFASGSRFELSYTLFNRSRNFCMQNDSMTSDNERRIWPRYLKFMASSCTLFN